MNTQNKHCQRARKSLREIKKAENKCRINRVCFYCAFRVRSPSLLFNFFFLPVFNSFQMLISLCVWLQLRLSRELFSCLLNGKAINSTTSAWLCLCRAVRHNTRMKFGDSRERHKDRSVYTKISQSRSVESEGERKKKMPASIDLDGSSAAAAAVDSCRKIKTVSINLNSQHPKARLLICISNSRQCWVERSICQFQPAFWSAIWCDHLTRRQLIGCVWTCVKKIQ